jgi:hypothetical protein
MIQEEVYQAVDNDGEWLGYFWYPYDTNHQEFIEKLKEMFGDNFSEEQSGTIDIDNI